MCGFLTELVYAGDLIDQQQFLKLLDLSKRRGPDSQGYWREQAAMQFGFNRLAILDLSQNANQPVLSYANRYRFVFNGEIYNHQDLRKKLKFEAFRGNSDTETLAACFEEWGVTETIKALNGMFAICVYDTLEKSTYLIRDFAGIKPLFYGWDGKKLVAASQFDQISKHPDFSSKSVNPSVLKLYLQQHFIPAPFGLYEDTFQVRPGEIVKFDAKGTCTKNRYWELQKSALTKEENPFEAIDRIDAALNKAVLKQTLSDVPLGAFLSGGVDSALVCSSLKRNAISPKVFTIGSDSKTHDESARSKAFADSLELQQHLWHLTATESLSYWDEAMQAVHEPIGDFSLLPTFLVSKLAKKHVSVALSGDGGDELFFGYERFNSVAKNIGFQHYPANLRKLIYAADRYTFNKKYVNEVLLASSQAVAHQGLHQRFRQGDLEALNPDLAAKPLPDDFDVFSYPNTKNKRELLGYMRQAEFYGMMQKTLRKVDLASMENSLEVRVPFLDKELIEVALSIDPLYNFKGQKQKYLLKKLLHQRIPQVPLETQKKGFSIPLAGWLRQALYEKFADILLSDKSREFGLRTAHIESMLQAHKEGKADYKWPLFTLYTLMK